MSSEDGLEACLGGKRLVVGAARKLTGDEALEEALAGEVGVVLLEVLLAGGGELHGNELEATVLEARDDGTNEATLEGWS
jgi:hypothetical protein